MQPSTGTTDVDRLEQVAFERERYLAWQAGQLAAVRREADGAHQAIKILQAELADLEADCAFLKADLAMIHRSGSWRLTRPFRVLAHPHRYLRRR